MEKQIREFKINYSLNWEYGIEISQLKKDIEAIEKLGATYINIESGISYDSSYVTIEPISRRLETEGECEKRMEEERKRQEEITRRELLQLETLKLKYNKPNHNQ